MADKTLGQKEALGIIEEMVNESLYKVEKEAKYFLLWGWMVFAAAMIQFFALLTGFENSWLVWPVMMGLAFAIYVFMIIRSKKDSKALSYIDRVNKVLWVGFLGPLVITILIGSVYGWQAAYPMFMALYGWAALVSGGLLKFKALRLGGMASMLIGAVSVFLPGIYLLLMLAAAVFFGFILPGHALSRSGS